MKPLLTARQAAEVLGVHEETVRTWARKRKLTATKIGGKFRFKEEWIEELLKPEAAPFKPTKRSAYERIVTSSRKGVR